MKYLIPIIAAIFLNGCAIFTEKAEWSADDYGGVDKKIAYLAHDATNTKAGMRPNTRSGNKSLLVHEREPNKTCVDHVVKAASLAMAHGIPYKVAIYKQDEGYYHAALLINDGKDVIDIKFGYPVPADEFERLYSGLHGAYAVTPDKIKPLFTALNGTFN